MTANDLEVRTDWDPHERSVGPVQGYYLALCAYETGDGPGQYIGYYKICAALPASYWGASCLFKGSTHAVRARPQDALADAEALARLAAGNLPPPATLEACHENRPLNVFELHVLGAYRGLRV